MADLNGAFADLSTAILNDACLRRGVPYHLAPPGLRPLRAEDRVAGRALPVRHFGSVDVFFEALERAEPGDVMVIDNGGRPDEGCIGDLVAIEAQAAGVGGIIVWGAYRDSAELRALGLPVFAYGAFPRGPLEARPREGDALDAAHLGDALVTPAHAVFADEDGAIFVPRDPLAGVFETAGAIRTRERAQAGRVRAGTNLRAQFRFAGYLERRAEDPGYTFTRHVKELGGAIGE